MKAVSRWCVTFLVVLPALSGGCSYSGSWWTVKIDAEESLTIPVDEAERIEVKTHDGGVSITSADATDAFIVHIKKQARARSQEEAEACMNAIQIVTDRHGDVQRFGWRWNPARRHGWSAKVAFDIQGPAHLGTRVETHNGGVRVTGMNGVCDLETHNGSITVEAGSDQVSALTHNGGVRVTAPAESIHLETHNGPVHAALAGARSVSGRIVTHNGGVTVDMDEQAGAAVDCRTHNGRISSELDLRDVSVSRSRLRGKLGEPTGELRVETHNGSIRLK